MTEQTLFVDPVMFQSLDEHDSKSQYQKKWWPSGIDADRWKWMLVSKYICSIVA